MVGPRQPGTHAGYTVAYTADGSEVMPWSPEPAGQVVGWRAGCVCGWRSDTYFDRVDWPSDDGLVPLAIDGDDNQEDGLAYREWDAHVRERRRIDSRCVISVERWGTKRRGWTPWDRT